MVKKVLGCCLMAAMALTAVPATIAASATNNVVATGVLRDKTGHGSSGRVFALAWPGEDLLRTLGPGAKIETPTVGEADTDRAGKFSIGVNDAAIPATHRRRDGGVNLILVGTDGSNEAMFFQPASSPSQMRSLVSGTAVRTPPSVTLTMNLPLSTAAKSLARSARSLGITPNAAPPPATYPCHGWSRGSSSLVWVSMGQSYSGPATNFAVLEQSSSVTDGTAFSATGAYGSWSASGSQTLTTGNTKTWTEALPDRDFQSQFQYSEWITLCQFGYQRHAFTPDFGTGGDAQPAATNYPARNYCTSISAGLWSRNSSSGSAYSESIGVKAKTELGIDLGVTHDYSSSTSTKFTLNYRNSSTATICGDTNYPALASKPRI